MSIQIDTFQSDVGLDLRPGSRDWGPYNVERVRSYLEKNLGCSRKEVCRDLRLTPRTVAKAIKVIRQKQA